MCGLWGFVASTRAPHGNGPRPEMLVRIALAGGERGPHACGWWTPSSGPEPGEMVHHLGPTSDYYADIMRLRAPIIVGHARLATVGAPDDRSNVQPLEWGGVIVAHNGIIPGARALWERVGGAPRTTNDSEVLAALVAQAPGADLAARVEWAMSLLDKDNRHALLATDGTTLVATRCGAGGGQPLYRAYAREGTYVCSRAFAGAILLPDDRVSVLASS